jgi:hypothetical protein
MKKLFTLILGITLAYSCSTSSDDNGNTNTTVVPLAPTNLIGTAASPTQINLSWTDNSTNETGFKIDRKVGSGTWVTDYGIINNADVTNFSDTSVSAGVTYSYRVSSFNSVGKSLTYSNEVTLTPTAAPLLPTLTTTAASSITLTTATSGGNISSDGGAAITARGVCWSTNVNPTIALSTKTNDGAGTGSFVSNITGLTASTTYYARAYATNNAGTAYGDQITFTLTFPTNGLVGYWPFNGNANDESGNGNNGTVSGATLTTDRNGNVDKAFYFDGINNNLMIPGSSSLTSIETFNKITVAGWFNNQNINVNAVFSFVNKYNPINDGGWEIILAENYANWSTEAFVETTNTCIPTLPVESWEHIAITYDQSTSIVVLYVNGINICTRNCSFTINNTNNGPLYFGYSPAGPDEFSRGKIDDIGIWNRALTQAEITALYNYR